MSDKSNEIDNEKLHDELVQNPQEEPVEEEERKSLELNRAMSNADKDPKKVLNSLSIAHNLVDFAIPA